MKKRILSAILVSALVLSMAGCNGDTPTSEPVSQQSQTSTSTSENKGQSSTTSEAVSSESTSTSSNSESTPSASSSSASNSSSSSNSSLSSTSTKPVVPTNQPSIVFTHNGSANTWAFETSDKQYYAYNLAENKLYELDKVDTYRICTMGQLVYYLYTVEENCYIQNASTKKTVMKGGSDDNSIHSFYWGSDRILVSKLEKGFSGNKLSVGVMNGKGEWIYPLEELSIDGIYPQEINLLGDKLLILSNPAYIYSFKNKSVTPVSIDGWMDTYWNATGDQILVSSYNRGFWCFDSSSENGVFYDKYGDFPVYTPSGNIVCRKYDKWDGKYYVLDSKTMKELGFDLSAYNVRSIIDVTKDRILFEAKNPDGDTYTIIMNKDGSLVTEPILSSSYDSDIISICDDCAIMSSHTIVNCKTGKTTKVDYEIKQVYNVYGMMVVYSGSNYYLVKPSEPDKLLSPFAIGQRV